MKSDNIKDIRYKKFPALIVVLLILLKNDRITENRGKIQRYGCKDCRKRFVKDDCF